MTVHATLLNELKATENPISCPFCGTSHSLIYGESAGFNRIECEECGAAGPVADSDGDALTLWQQRVEAKDAQYTGSIN